VVIFKIKVLNVVTLIFHEKNKFGNSSFFSNFKENLDSEVNFFILKKKLALKEIERVANWAI
jgi:hypothetical protein